ncbi:MAG: ribonuclease HI [Deltaproteobacteria bacterium]|nr:ribonuclease HI [Deltaproteobacteria bacterium]
MNQPTDQVTLYCDGSCLGNPGRGGWAALLVVEKNGARNERLLSGNTPATTNNRMELLSAIEGLRALKRPCRVHVVTDSNYVIKGMTEWRFGWEKRGWKNSQRKPVENQDLWHALIAEAAKHQVSWAWVEGHAGHPENERVDEAARAAAAELRP